MRKVSESGSENEKKRLPERLNPTLQLPPVQLQLAVKPMFGSSSGEITFVKFPFDSLNSPHSS